MCAHEERSPWMEWLHLIRGSRFDSHPLEHSCVNRKTPKVPTNVTRALDNIIGAKTPVPQIPVMGDLYGTALILKLEYYLHIIITGTKTVENNFNRSMRLWAQKRKYTVKQYIFCAPKHGGWRTSLQMGDPHGSLNGRLRMGALQVHGKSFRVSCGTWY